LCPDGEDRFYLAGFDAMLLLEYVVLGHGKKDRIFNGVRDARRAHVRTTERLSVLSEAMSTDVGE
jgi:hypothetical protein